MSIRSRAVVTAAFACAPLVLVSACGDGGGTANGARSTLQYVPATNYVVKEPPTTTTTTTVPDAEQTGGVSAEEQTYVVQSGDALYAIATDHGVDMQTLCDYNQWDTCGTEHAIFEGDEILIPPNSNVVSADADDGETAEGATTETDSIDEQDDGAETTAPAGEGCTYTIEAGDTPGGVASDYGITFEQLQAANPSRDFSSWFLVTADINIPPEGDC